MSKTSKIRKLKRQLAEAEQIVSNQQKTIEMQGSLILSLHKKVAVVEGKWRRIVESVGRRGESDLFYQLVYGTVKRIPWQRGNIRLPERKHEARVVEAHAHNARLETTSVAELSALHVFLRKSPVAHVVELVHDDKVILAMESVELLRYPRAELVNNIAAQLTIELQKMEQESL